MSAKKKGVKRDKVVSPRSIEVSREMWEELKKRKLDGSYSSVDQVIRAVFGNSSVAAQAIAQVPKVPVWDEEDENDDGKTRLPQKMFSSQVVRNVKALKYYTGLSQLMYKWVLKAMRNAVRFSSFFAFCLV